MTRKPWSEIEPIAVLRDPVWGRQPGETAKAFAAWAIYRDLPVFERSIKRATEKMGRRNTAVLEDWNKKYRWQTRKEAWDLHCEDIAIAAQEKAVVEMHERWAHMAFEGLRKVTQRLTGDDDEGITAIDPSKLSAQDVARLSEVFVKIEGLARGDATERIDNQHRPVEIKLAFDSEPRYRPDTEGVALPVDESDYLELPPAA